MDIFGNFSNLEGDKKKRKAIIEVATDFQYQDPVLEGQVKLEEVDEKRSFPFLKIGIVIVFLFLITKLFFLQVILI